MKIVLGFMILSACACLQAQDIGRAEPPFVEATVTMPSKQITNSAKRYDMVSDLAEKSEMNYRLLGMKIMEKWRTSMKSDREFLKNLLQYKTVAFTVKKDGTIVIEGVEDPASPDGKNDGKKTKAGSKKTSTTKKPAPADVSAPADAPEPAKADSRK